LGGGIAGVAEQDAVQRQVLGGGGGVIDFQGVRGVETELLGQVVAVGSAAQCGYIAGDAGGDGRVAAASGGDQRAVGGDPVHPAGAEFDQYLDGGVVRLGGGCRVGGVAERVNAGEQVGKPGGERAVAAGLEVRLGGVQLVSQIGDAACFGGAGRPQQCVLDPGDQGGCRAGGRLDGRGGADGQRGESAEEFAPSHRVITCSCRGPFRHPNRLRGRVGGFDARRVGESEHHRGMPNAAARRRNTVMSVNGVRPRSMRDRADAE